MSQEFDDYGKNGKLVKKIKVNMDSSLMDFLMSFYKRNKDDMCRVRSPSGRWVCTRKKGHTRQHIGHNDGGAVGIWDNPDAPEEDEEEEMVIEVPVETIHNVFDPYGWRKEEADD